MEDFSSPDARMSQPPDVVIFGGGIAGATVAHRLRGACSITLVDPLDYFEIPMSAPRSLIDPQFADHASFPFSVALPHVRHIKGRLIEWSDAGGLVDDGSNGGVRIAGKTSVIATGSRFSNALMRSEGGSLDERKAFYGQFSDRLRTAQRVVIVGGGPIGIEVAGEISERYPTKDLTILEAASDILRSTSPAMAHLVRRKLEARGVRILTSEAINDAASACKDALQPAGSIKTSQGHTLDYDLLIWCIGGRPNTQFMARHSAHLLDAVGRIKVRPDLRIIDLDTVFALGDVTDLPENKMAWHVLAQVKVAVANIRSVVSGREPTQTYQARTGDPTMVVTLGSRDGASQLPMFGLVSSAKLNRFFKSRDMLVPKFRKNLGLHPHK